MAEATDREAKAAADWDVVVGYADRLSARPGRAPAGDGVVRRPARARARAPAERRAGAGDGHAAGASRPSSRCGRALTSRFPTTRPCGPPTGSRSRPGSGSRRELRRTDGAPWSRAGDRGVTMAGRWCSIPTAGRVSKWQPRADRGSRSPLSALPLDAWWRLEGVLDPASDEIAVSRFDRFGSAVDCGREAAGLAAPGPAPGPLLIGAERRGPDAPASSHLDGKLEAPTVGAGPGGAVLVAAWELGSERGPRVADRGPLRLDGRCINGPLRAVTGRRWSGDVHDWRSAAEGYEAMHFHSDAVDDLGWEPTLELEIDEDCAERRLRRNPARRRTRGPGPVRRSASRRGRPRRPRRPLAELHLPRLLLRTRRPGGDRIRPSRGPLGREPAPAQPL